MKIKVSLLNLFMKCLPSNGDYFPYNMLTQTSHLSNQLFTVEIFIKSIHINRVSYFLSKKLLSAAL